MKNLNQILSIAILSVVMVSCNDKKLEEVEVPLPEEVAKNENLGNPADVFADEGTFKMPGLKYNYDALAPYIDAKTMEIHYSKHHLGYTNNLNKAIAGTAQEKMTIEEILTSLDMENKAVRNNAGGFYNHNLFWEILSPKTNIEPTGELASAIKSELGGFETLKEKLSDAATKQFGSGWAWLVVDKSGKLQIGSTANQDNPLMPNAGISGTPILGIDVWEHAYYLNYQNKRKDYIDAIFNIINWDVVGKKYSAIKNPIAIQ